MDIFQEFLDQIELAGPSGLITQLGILLLWTLLIFLIAWIIRKAINKQVKDNSSRYRAKKVVRLVSYILILILAIVTFTGKAQYFTLAVGLISAGLAFALQEVVLSIAGWVAIFAARIYSPGDRIELDDVRGDVIDIGITRTTLMEIGSWISGDNYSGRIVQISNSSVFKKPVFNYSTDFPFVWDEVKLHIRYGSDLEMASQMIMGVANEQLIDYSRYAEEHWKGMVKKYLIENARVEPMLTLQLLDSSIEFTLRYVVDFKKRKITKHELFMTLQTRLSATGGKVTLASATYEVTDLPEIHVKLSGR